MEKLKCLWLLFLLVFIGCTGESSDDVDENLPVIATVEVTLITDYSAQTGGEIISEGTSPVTGKGVCWSTNQNPTIDDKYVVADGGDTRFTSELINLEPETQYFVRSYATNATGISYGDAVEFVTEELQINAPCSPEANTMDHQGMLMTFGKPLAGEQHGHFGDYGVIANGSRGDLRVDFSHVPMSGIYTIVSDFSLNKTLNECMISAVVDMGTLNSWCTSGPSAGDSVYVVRLGEGSYSITFCDVEFSCLVGYTDYHFTTDAHITN